MDSSTAFLYKGNSLSLLFEYVPEREGQFSSLNCKKQVFDQQFSEKLISADFGKLVLHIVIDKAVMQQRAAASLLHQSQYAEPAFVLALPDVFLLLHDTAITIVAAVMTILMIFLFIYCLLC